MAYFIRAISCCLLAWAVCSPLAAQDSQVQRSADQFRLLGVWFSNCYKLSAVANLNSQHFGKDNYTFGASGSYILETTHYRDAQCTQPLSDALVFYGDYTLGEPPEGATVRQRRILLSLDNADWPQELAPASLNWVVTFTKDRLLLGPYAPPTHTPFQGYWLEKSLAVHNGVFVF